MMLDFRPLVKFRVSAILKNMKAESMWWGFSFSKLPKVVSLFFAGDNRMVGYWGKFILTVNQHLIGPNSMLCGNNLISDIFFPVEC